MKNSETLTIRAPKSTIRQSWNLAKSADQTLSIWYAAHLSKALESDQHMLHLLELGGRIRTLSQATTSIRLDLELVKTLRAAAARLEWRQSQILRAVLCYYASRESSESLPTSLPTSIQVPLACTDSQVSEAFGLAVRFAHRLEHAERGQVDLVADTFRSKLESLKLNLQNIELTDFELEKIEAFSKLCQRLELQPWQLLTALILRSQEHG